MYKNDRRTFDRFEVKFPAEIKGSNGQTQIDAQCCDVSAIGAGLITDQKLTPNSNIELWLAMPNGHAPLRSLARVVWSKQVRQNRWRSGTEFKTADFMGIRRAFAALGKKVKIKG